MLNVGLSHKLHKSASGRFYHTTAPKVRIRIYALSRTDYTISSKLTQAIMLHTIIWKMRSSNLTLGTHYPG